MTAEEIKRLAALHRQIADVERRLAELLEAAGVVMRDLKPDQVDELTKARMRQLLIEKGYPVEPCE